MKSGSRLRAALPGALPTLVVLIVVVAAGGRLMYLSVQHHTAVAREAAGKVGALFAARLEAPLDALANTARAAASGSLSPAHVLRMGPADSVLSAPAPESGLARDIASEWQSAESRRALPGAAFLGPMRLGSRWIVAARVPAAATPGADAAAGWYVAYADLETLVARAGLAHLTGLGYDFQLAQVVADGAQPRIFLGSSLEPLTDSLATRVQLPLATLPGTHLELVIRPHAGWYPVNLLVADAALLAFLAWLFAFGTHDLSHALQRAREALATSRRRLHHVNQQLASEMQQRMTLQETYSHALFHDAVTGIPNRRYFMDRLDRALRDIRRKQRSRIAVLLIEIARFKLISGLLGHTAGDELMVQAARRFEGTAAGFEGVLARWSADQFAVLLLEVESPNAAMDIGAQLTEGLRLPFQVRRHQLVVAASVGMTFTASGQQRAEDIVREADIALSVAKQNETSRIVLYAPSMSGQAATLVSLEADLHIALEKRQLHLLLQPIVDLRTNRMVGAEALLRWLHPLERELAPDRFLRIAEDAGLMVPITRWVILRALKTVANWRQRVPADLPFYISVNLSATALRDAELGAYVATLLQQTGIPPGFIKFEVTEAALVSNIGAARNTLEQLHALGVGLMLDDFGTGFTSLSNLHLFPFDFVKIERPFINLDNTDQANTGMMAAMVQMAASLQLTAIAEIIESEAAASTLQQMGCRYGQGYYFSAPVEAEEILERLRSQEPFRPRAGPPADTSPTQIIPSLDVASPTVKVPPLDHPAVGPARRDASPTVMLPSLPP